MIVYSYSSDTGELVGQFQARLDPLETKVRGENVFLIPANATTNTPPVIPDGKVAVFKEGTWSLVDDYRGQTTYANDGSLLEIESLGTIPDGYSLTPPEPTLEEIRAKKKQELATKRYTLETGGITVNNVHIQTDRESRSNLIAARTLAKEDATYSTYWKTADGSFMKLDAETIIAIADAVVEHVEKCFRDEMQLAAQIDAATTLEELRAIEI